jgi:hypothetical protein
LHRDPRVSFSKDVFLLSTLDGLKAVYSVSLLPDARWIASHDNAATITPAAARRWLSNSNQLADASVKTQSAMIHALSWLRPTEDYGSLPPWLAMQRTISFPPLPIIPSQAG